MWWMWLVTTFCFSADHQYAEEKAYYTASKYTESADLIVLQNDV